MMRLAYNNQTIAMLVAVLFLTLSLVAGLLIVDVEPVHADTCGTNYLYQWTCRTQCENTGPCGGGKSWFECQEERVYKYTNPWSDKDMGPTGYFPINCTEWWDETCPTFCN